ncbi:hypothetical protein Pogu_1291 [Pyrobaculum oguniense TE7]|mgnify:CR=1 FL=1|uniref:Uncharacterized protein n=1 Tax=Pyrobaculum oguniense (strain DSM 13380 / JCM 10595 / TE7) TaxID=698757 RepID=H6QAB7_PYROT|nr:hypothetical protein Pogu_1291 [Pyrobaculum oguniense TE7]
MKIKHKVLAKTVEVIGAMPMAKYVAIAIAAGALSLILYPGLWNTALGGLLERLIPGPIYNAVHELRHLWGMPCH